MFSPVWLAFSLLERRDKLILTSLLVVRVFVQLLDLAGLAAVGFLGALLASGLTGRDEATFLGVTIPFESSAVFLWLVLITAGFFLTKSLLASILLRQTTRFLAKVEAKAAREVTNYLFSGGLSRLRGFSRGEQVWLSGTSSHVAFSTMLFSGSALITETALFVTIFLAFAVIDLSSTAIITGYFAALILVFQLVVNRRLKRLGERLAGNSVSVNNAIVDLGAAFREITVLEKTAYFLQKFDQSRSQFARDAGLQRYVMGLPRFLVEAALMVGFLALVLWQFARGTLSEGLVITSIFLTGGLRMMAAMLPLQNAISEIRTTGPQAIRALEIVKAARAENLGTSIFDVNAPETDQRDDQRGYSVTVDSVDFSFPDSDDLVLKSVSLDIREGEFVAFVGPSGAGKTSLADVILGIHTPERGKTLIDGQEPRLLRKRFPGSIAYVPQKTGLVSGSIAENVALGVGLEDIDFSRVWEVIEESGLEAVMHRLPDSIYTDVGKQHDALSGGQIQRIGLARALYTRPRLVILDEATSALDAETENDVQKTIRTLVGQTTVLVIAHRLSTVMNADRVFVIEDGRISAQGPFQDLRKHVPLIEKYVRLMSLDPADDPFEEPRDSGEKPHPSAGAEDVSTN